MEYAKLFSYSFKNHFNQAHITKRSILAMNSQLYDPLGLLAPIIINAKLIIQELWQIKLGWDESIPMNVYTLWTNFKNNLPIINIISVPISIG